MAFDAPNLVTIGADELASLRRRAAAGDALAARLARKMNDEAAKAWDALARYKFIMFGYHVAVWVVLRAIEGLNRPNPFAGLVRIARDLGFGPGTPGGAPCSR